MTFLCCGIKYSKRDPETYWCIETDVIKNQFTKKSVKGENVCKEIVETLTCKKHGCLQVHVKRFGRFRNKFKCLEVEKLSGEEAAQFLINTEKIRNRLPQAIPFKFISVSKTIPPCYGKTLSPYTQRARYINEQDWGFGSEVIYNECKVYKLGT
nr:MAG TPA: hypothetical protein [Bacteriophage sp.]